MKKVQMLQNTSLQRTQPIANNSEEKSKLEIVYDFIVGNSIIVKDSNNTYFCMPKSVDKNLVMRLDGREMRDWIITSCREQFKMFLKAEDIKNIIPHLHTVCNLTTVDYAVELRCQHLNDKIFIDLCNNQYSFIEINANKTLLVTKENKPIFYRNSSMKEIQVPNLKSPSKNLLALLSKYFVLNENQLLLLAVYICSCFIADIESPILFINGSKGSAKSTTSRFIKEIVDPSTNNLSLLTKNSNDFAVLLNSCYMIVCDNVSEKAITSDFSSMLCVAVTGASLTSRKLYSDDEPFHKNLRNKIIINGIDSSILKKSDVLDRTLSIELYRIDDTKFISPTELKCLFNQDLPLILGSICNTLSKAIAIKNYVKLDKVSRLVDFYTWGYAIAEAMDKLGDKFIECYDENTASRNQKFIDEESVALCLIEYMKNKHSIEISVGDLFIKLKEIAKEKDMSIGGHFPANYSALGRKLNDIESNLSEIGINFTRTHTSKYKVLTITNSNFKPNSIEKKKIKMRISTTKK